MIYSIDSYIGCELLSHEDAEKNLKHAEYTTSNFILYHVEIS